MTVDMASIPSKTPHPPDRRPTIVAPRIEGMDLEDCSGVMVSPLAALDDERRVLRRPPETFK